MSRKWNKEYPEAVYQETKVGKYTIRLFHVYELGLSQGHETWILESGKPDIQLSPKPEQLYRAKIRAEKFLQDHTQPPPNPDSNIDETQKK